MLCAPDLLWPCRVSVIIPILLMGKLRPTKITMLAYHGYLVGEPGFDPAWLVTGPEPPPPSHGTSRGQGPGDQTEQGAPPQVVLTPKGGRSALLQSDCTGAGGIPFLPRGSDRLSEEGTALRSLRIFQGLRAGAALAEGSA